MTVVALTLLLATGSVAAGFLGALTGLGGGVVIVPILVLLFGIDIHYAIGTSLICVIATSSGAAAAYVREGYSNIRVGMFLEIATTLGALSGAAIAMHVSPSSLAMAFGFVLLYSAYRARQRGDRPALDRPADRFATLLRLDSSCPTATGPQSYRVHRVPLGFGLMYVAGVLSGLLGIGSGAVKVLAMDQAMRLPFKVSTTTSNFMIGVTAAASAGVYLHRGYIDPGLAMPVMLGVLFGAMQGARVLDSAQPQRLRAIFSWVIVGLAIEMLFNGFTGRI
jgi:uncharacterized membrane protein YfcA